MKEEIYVIVAEGGTHRKAGVLAQLVEQSSLETLKKSKQNIEQNHPSLGKCRIAKLVFIKEYEEYQECDRCGKVNISKISIDQLVGVRGYMMRVCKNCYEKVKPF